MYTAALLHIHQKLYHKLLNKTKNMVCLTMSYGQFIVFISHLSDSLRFQKIYTVSTIIILCKCRVL